jgi:hypothetical protein
MRVIVSNRENIMATSREARLIAKLKEQLQFIRRSCEAFDGGVESEAIRIATALRVIFHTSKTSTPLVALLGIDGERMLSSSRGWGNWQDYLKLEMNLNSPEPIRCLPLLGSPLKELPIAVWWNKESVFTYHAQNYTRRKIILSAADKDGGAHVDEKLEEYYESLCGGVHALGITGNLTHSGKPPFPQGITQYPKNSHLALIRQFGHEAALSFDRFACLRG